jgi:hypothetical protein
VWLSTDSGAHWTPVTIPVDHGAQNAISGVSFDGAGLIAVRPGRTASGASDGVAYFSSDGRTWQYAGTIAAAGGWSPDVVKGSDYGFVVAGRHQGPVRGLHQHRNRHEMAADRVARQHVQRSGLHPGGRPGRPRHRGRQHQLHPH